MENWKERGATSLSNLGLSRKIDRKKDNCPKLDFSSNAEIWAIGGGKGGVGKSLFTANISICLALMGHKVVGIDLDLGGANLHTCLGHPIPERTLSDYLNRRSSNLNDLVNQTSIDNLGLISGAQDDVGITNIKNTEKNRILSKIRELDAEYIIIDLGAGTSINTLDFFLSADHGILVTLPEPTSIENTYRFIRSLYYRKLKTTEEFLEISPLIDQAINAKIEDKTTPIELFDKVAVINPEIGAKLKSTIQRFCPSLVINQVRTQVDMDIGPSMQIVCRKYFGIALNYLGHLEYDSVVWQSVKRRRPLVTTFPDSNLIANFDKIIRNLLSM